MPYLQAIPDYFERHKLRLVTAESFTGGIVAAMLGDLPGCESWLESGLVTYAADAKCRCLGVKRESIEKYTLNSEPVAREMATGALRNSRANIALANTGLAGPSPQEGVPSGTICFAWAYEHRGRTVVFSETRRYDGERNAVRRAGAEYAIERVVYYHAQLISDAAA